MNIRLIYDFLLLILFFYLPWYFFAPFALLGLVFFRKFWELIVFAIAMDLLYAADTSHFLDFHFMVTVGAVIFYFIAEMLRRQLRPRSTS